VKAARGRGRFRVCSCDNLDAGFLFVSRAIRRKWRPAGVS
jgi:hypothetical protein